MRVPGDIVQRRGDSSKRQVVIVLVVAALVVLILSLRGIAVFYTDYLWFRSINLSVVWRNTLFAKLELAGAFTVGFFVLSLISLTIADKMQTQVPPVDANKDELVARYGQSKERHPRLLRVLASLVAALIVGSGASAQWKSFILFQHSVPFHKVDPQFHMDYSFFVFKLPFLMFLVRWSFLALVIIFILTTGLYYLNGNIRSQGRAPRVSPKVKAHMSVLLALLAIVKAYGYYLQRFQLDTSTSGYVEGAAYTDVHALLPALTLLVFISLGAGVLFVINIRRQGWVLPVIGLGLWAFLSLVLGAIYPAIIQQFVVQPAQGTKELPYIARNIEATRYGMSLENVQTQNYNASQNISGQGIRAYAKTLAGVRLWDASVALPTFDKLQDIRSYYHFNSLAVDDYSIDGTKTPIILGIRQLNSSNLPSQSWVNLHLQYTHGYGAVVAPANKVNSDGNPNFLLANLPPSAQSGAPSLTQPQVYYSLNNPGYVIANSRQPEIDYQVPSGLSVETHYAGSGGVRLSSTLIKAAFALRYGDINILISSLVDTNSRLMLRRDIQVEAQDAAPFLKFGSNPYPVIANGSIYWVQNAYTTTSQLPYGQAADVSNLSPSSGLNAYFNYVRNSVKVVTNAYTGQMTFYVSDPRDPIIRAYEAEFPGVFKPMSQMSQALRSHMRYPEDLFVVQSTMYGKYHVTNASNFYSAGSAWTLSPNPGNGSPSAALSQTVTTNAAGFPVSSQISAMPPLYEQITLPNSDEPHFGIVEAFVPISQTQVQQNLTAVMVGLSDGGTNQRLVSLVTPSGEQIDGPGLAAARITAQTAISQEISLLDQHGSQVQLGSLMIVPLGQNLMYVRPLYVASTQNQLPEIKQVIVVYGTQVAMEPTFAGALNDIFGVNIPGVQGYNQVAAASQGNGSSTSQSVPVTPVAGEKSSSVISKAANLYLQAQAALKSGNLALYQQDIDAIGALLGVNNSSTSSTTSTTLPG
jgi:uncharacterized membrane protein (UPF0182 family)